MYRKENKVTVYEGQCRGTHGAAALLLYQDPENPKHSLPAPDVTVNTRKGAFVTYEAAQNEQ